MKKQILLKSVYVGFEQGRPGEVQIQRIERWTGAPEGLTVPDTYLPVERFALSAASPSERASLEAALGEMATGHASQAEAGEAALAELHAQVAALTAERDEVRGRAEATAAALVDARAQIDVLEAERAVPQVDPEPEAITEIEASPPPAPRRPDLA